MTEDTTLNPAVPDKPIAVPASPVGDIAGTFGRDLLIVVGVIPAAVAVLGQHDLNATIQFIESAQFAPALGVLTVAGVSIWRALKAWKKNTNDKRLARSADNSVGFVVGDPPH